VFATAQCCVVTVLLALQSEAVSFGLQERSLHGVYSCTDCSSCSEAS
jgi:hypothetical protein